MEVYVKVLSHHYDRAHHPKITYDTTMLINGEIAAASKLGWVYKNHTITSYGPNNHDFLISITYERPIEVKDTTNRPENI